MVNLWAEAFSFPWRQAPRVRHTSLAAKRRSCMSELQILLRDGSDRSSCHTSNKNKKTNCFCPPPVILLQSSCHSVQFSVMVSLRADAFSFALRRAPRARHTSLAATRRSCMCKVLQDRTEKSICHTTHKNEKTRCFHYSSVILLLSSCYSILFSSIVTLRAEAFPFVWRPAP